MNNKRILYFTNSYPYGKGLEWKRRELLAISKEFEEVIVVPFSYEGCYNPKKVPFNVTVWDPFFDSADEFYQPKELLKCLFTADWALFIKELVEEKAYKKRYWFKNWMVAINKIYKLKRHSSFRKIAGLESKKNTLMYFFWGNNFAHLIPFFKEIGFEKFLVRYHGFDLYAERNGGYQPFQKTVIEHSTLIAPISQHGLKYLRDSHSIEFKGNVIRLGVEDKGFSFASEDGVLRIFSCSRLIKLKRIALLASALKNIKEFPVEWVHIGDGEELNNIKSITTSYGKNIQVNFLGWVDSSLVYKHYVNAKADLFVNVSESEGVPVSIMEAFSAGIPVMATDVGGVSEILDQFNGILIDKNITEEQLADKISFFYKLTKIEKQVKREGARATFEKMCESRLLENYLVHKLKEL